MRDDPPLSGSEDRLRARARRIQCRVNIPHEEIRLSASFDNTLQGFCTIVSDTAFVASLYPPLCFFQRTPSYELSCLLTSDISHTIVLGRFVVCGNGSARAVLASLYAVFAQSKNLF